MELSEPPSKLDESEVSSADGTESATIPGTTKTSLVFHRIVILSVARRIREPQHTSIRLIDSEALRCLDSCADDRRNAVRLAAAAIHRDLHSARVLIRGACAVNTIVCIRAAIGLSALTYRAVPLVFAVCGGSVAVVAALLRAGASPVGPAMGGTPFGRDDGTPRVHVGGFELPLHRRRDNNLLSLSPLHAASTTGRDAIVATLLTAGASPDACDRFGSTPLIFAAGNGHIATVRALLAGGADVNVANCRHITALCAAACHGHTDVVRALLAAGAAIDVADDDGVTPLVGARGSGHTDTVQTLFKRFLTRQQQRRGGGHHAHHHDMRP